MRPRALGLLALLAGACFLVWGCGNGRTPSTPAPPSTTPAPPPAAPQILAWPVGGEEGADWVINSYVDVDPGSGRRDYRDGDRTYNGHDGTDIHSPNFRWMDRDLPPVLAAASGRVSDLRDGEFDRHSSVADAPWNFVEITHADGSRAIYGHLKNGSVAVSRGQTVTAGQQLGVVGSSGRSTRPHLHFEFRSADNRVLDPFLERMWADPPAYDPPLSIMDYHVQHGVITLRVDKGLREFTDPPPNIDSIAVGGTMAIGLAFGGASPATRSESPCAMGSVHCGGTGSGRMGSRDTSTGGGTQRSPAVPGTGRSRSRSTEKRSRPIRFRSPPRSSPHPQDQATASRPGGTKPRAAFGRNQVTLLMWPPSTARTVPVM